MFRTRSGRDACDLIMGYAQGTGLIDDSNPYYRTSYVLIYRQDDPNLAGVDRLSDPRLKGKRIGLFARTPPASMLALYGLWHTPSRSRSMPARARLRRRKP